MIKRILFVNFLLITSVINASPWNTQVMQTSIKQAADSCNVPEDILYAIATVESNLWPWTAHLRGKSYYFNTKADAVKFALDHQKKGIHDVNVGLMQIFWPIHRKSIKSFDELFDPGYNILFAAKLLQRLKNQLGSWEKAVKAYHSSVEKYGNLYGRKISQELNEPLESM